jgi:hypothetical protein
MPWSVIRAAAASNSTSSACLDPATAETGPSVCAIAPDAVWEASDIVADIQEAYELAAFA